MERLVHAMTDGLLVRLQALWTLFGNKEGNLIAVTRACEAQQRGTDPHHDVLLALLLARQAWLHLLDELTHAILRLGCPLAVLVEHRVQLPLRACLLHFDLQLCQIGQPVQTVAQLQRGLLDLLVQCVVLAARHLLALVAVQLLYVVCGESGRDQSSTWPAVSQLTYPCSRSCCGTPPAAVWRCSYPAGWRSAVAELLREWHAPPAAERPGRQAGRRRSERTCSL